MYSYEVYIPIHAIPCLVVMRYLLHAEAVIPAHRCSRRRVNEELRDTWFFSLFKPTCHGLWDCPNFQPRSSLFKPWRLSTIPVNDCNFGLRISQQDVPSEHRVITMPALNTSTWTSFASIPSTNLRSYTTATCCVLSKSTIQDGTQSASILCCSHALVHLPITTIHALDHPYHNPALLRELGLGCRTADGSDPEWNLLGHKFVPLPTPDNVWADAVDLLTILFLLSV